MLASVFIEIGLFLAQVVVETIVWILWHALRRVLSIFGVPGASQRPHLRRLEHLRTVRRNRAIKRWLASSNRRGALPAMGLTCPTCDYSLTGLTEQRCPECGAPFDVATFIRE